jgi:uncharacterized protein
MRDEPFYHTRKFMKGKWMKAIALLEKYFADPGALAIILEHSRLVAAKALQVADSLGSAGIDRRFVEEAALLHDIGVCRTASPGLGCVGEAPYIRHGIIGREILEAEGLPRHALVCERHIGVGLTVDDIRTQNLPLPEREMSPVSIEERLVCFADLFYSKKPASSMRDKSVHDIRESLFKFGEHKVGIFDGWLLEFNYFDV